MNLVASFASSRRHVATAALWWGAACCAVLSAAMGADATAQPVRQARSVAGFTALDLRTVAKVEVRQGEVASVEAEADPATQALVDTRVETGSLIVEDTRPLPKGPIQVTIVMPRLEALAASGSTQVSLGRFSGANLAVNLSGTSKVSAPELELKQLQLKASGGAQLRLAGRAEELVLSLSGVANVEASKLASRGVTIQSSGSSQSTVWAREQLVVASSGSAGVRYYGKPALTVANTGVSTVHGLGAAPADR
jgi:hypothetical protein